MNVLHITNNYPTENLPVFGIFVKEQIEELSNIGVNNTIFFINGREKGKLEYIKCIYRLNKLMKKNKFDIIHCHHALSALCLIFSGNSNKNKVIVSFQNDPTKELGMHIFKFIKKRTCIQIFKNNSTLINKHSSCVYLPNGVNLDFFRPVNRIEACSKIGIDPSHKYILFISSNYIRKQKRYDRFQSVISLLNSANQKPEFKELKMTSTRRELVPFFFNAANLHLLTSDFEGSPNSVKEAMACNIPVVSTDVGNVKELLENVTNSYVAEGFRPEELVNLVKKSMCSSSSGKSGREKIMELKLDSKSVAKTILNLYKSLMFN